MKSVISLALVAALTTSAVPVAAQERIDSTTVTFVSTNVMAQSTGSVTPRVRVTRDGKRVSGRLTAVDADALTLLPDDNSGPIRILLSSISAAEVSEGKRSRAVADLAGVGVGVSGVYIADAVCGGSRNPNDQSEASCGRALLVALLISVPSGIAIAHLIGHERWRRVPIASLVSLVTPAAIRP